MYVRFPDSSEKLQPLIEQHRMSLVNQKRCSGTSAINENLIKLWLSHELQKNLSHYKTHTHLTSLSAQASLLWGSLPKPSWQEVPLLYAYCITYCYFVALTTPMFSHLPFQSVPTRM